MKFKVTNTSQLSTIGKRNIFLTEAGKLIKPGEFCLCHRLDSGTMSLVDAKSLKVEEGDFTKEPIFKNKKEPAKADKAEELVKAEEPAKAEELVKAEEPAKAEELVKAEEPAKAEELVKAEEPAKAEELVKAEEPAKAEEPVKAEEPAKAEGKPNKGRPNKNKNKG